MERGVDVLTLAVAESCSLMLAGGGLLGAPVAAISRGGEGLAGTDAVGLMGLE